MTEQEYNQLPGLRASVIKAGMKSMKHMRWAATETIEPTPAMRWGTLIHAAVLEPKRYAASRAIFAGDKRGKAWTEFKDVNAPEWIVTQAENDELIAMQAAVLNNPDAARLLADGVAEEALWWTGDGYGKAKCRMDWYNGGKHYWLDLKSTSRIDKRSFGTQCAQLGYDLQIGWYNEGFACLQAGAPDVYIIAVESKPPFDVAVYQVPRQVIEYGRARSTDLARKYAACCAAGVWPGVQPDMMPLEMPEWWGMESTNAPMAGWIVGENE